MAERRRSHGKISWLRVNEAIEGLKKLSSPIFLNLPDGELGSEINHRKIIKESIFRAMPDLIALFRK